MVFILLCFLPYLFIHSFIDLWQCWFLNSGLVCAEASTTEIYPQLFCFVLGVTHALTLYPSLAWSSCPLCLAPPCWDCSCTPQWLSMDFQHLSYLWPSVVLQKCVHIWIYGSVWHWGTPLIWGLQSFRDLGKLSNYLFTWLAICRSLATSGWDLGQVTPGSWYLIQSVEISTCRFAK